VTLVSKRTTNRQKRPAVDDKLELLANLSGTVDAAAALLDRILAGETLVDLALEARQSEDLFVRNNRQFSGLGSIIQSHNSE